jgi:hypothetical protein
MKDWSVSWTIGVRWTLWTKANKLFKCIIEKKVSEFLDLNNCEWENGRQESGYPEIKTFWRVWEITFSSWVIFLFAR